MSPRPFPGSPPLVVTALGRGSYHGQSATSTTLSSADVLPLGSAPKKLGNSTGARSILGCKVRSPGTCNTLHGTHSDAIWSRLRGLHWA